MRVMIVISNSGVGGSQRVAMHLAQWLEDSFHHSCEIIALKPPTGESFDMSGFKFEEIKSNRVITELRSLIKSRKPDVLLSMGVPMCIYTVPACLFTKTKHIISERNDPSHFAGKSVIKIFSRLLMRLGDGFVFQTNDAKEFYGKRIANKSKVIANPLFNLELMPKNVYSGEREKNIVTVGRLNKQKNHILLIEAFSIIIRKYPEYTLTIWGEGEERATLENYIRELKLEKNVFLPGSTSDVFNNIYNAALFVLSSDFEGMPNALMEAMALGLPCIATDCPCGGPKDLIIDEYNGKLVPVGNTKLLANAMEELISNKNKASEIGKNATEIRENYAPQTICSEWLTFFENVLGA